MADRVHPQPQGSSSPPPSSSETKPLTSNRAPKPGTYVVQIPKDQIYRYPPTENARRYESLTRPKRRRSGCCYCFCCLCCAAACFVVALAVAAAVLYLVFRPKLPEYSVGAVSVAGFNFSSAAALSYVSPSINVTVRADNPNDKISIRYLGGSAVGVYYSDVALCDGVLPRFRQPANNVTEFRTALKRSSALSLKSSDRTALVKAQRSGKVPLTIKLKAPVKIQVGAVSTWEITVKVSCDVTVNGLTAKSKIVSNDCSVRVKLW